MKTYADYVEAMKALPWHQQWAMFLGAKTDKMIAWDTPIGSIDDMKGVHLGITESGKLVASLNMSDTFYYATADGEGIAPYEVLLVEQAIRKLGPRADVEWVSRKRGVNPLKPTDITNEQWIGFLADLDALIAAHEHFRPWWHEEPND